ncbi:universal stress protein E [Constrictibacter sp. MBR-5]|jgi:nucleotide-binding universal stress UspA family protein|uniref:universal stress protein n=1 Tax=Constrictibacter sp. MBR-5 TaxID=3156467 RepID=UPI0033990340
MGIKRLLAATDFSGRSERAVARAARLCREHGAELRLLHIVDDDQPLEMVEQETRQGEALLRSQASALREAAGVEPLALIRAGDPFDEIVRSAVATEANLIALGAHRRQILRDIFVGTTVERVMRTGHHPVLMVNNVPVGPYRRIMATTDLSDASAHALRTAEELGFLDGADVLLLHAFEPMAKSMLIYANVARDKVKEHVAHEMAEARRNVTSFLANLGLGTPAMRIALEEGPPFLSIKKRVDKEKPDLLIIGTRGLTGAARFLLGSVAEAVLRDIECDVLAVPQRSE